MFTKIEEQQEYGYGKWLTSTMALAFVAVLAGGFCYGAAPLNDQPAGWHASSTSAVSPQH